MLFILIILFLIVLTVLVSEVMGYLWHRFAAHNDNPVGDTHRIHHDADLTHEAHEDFLWVISILIIGSFFLIFFYDKLPISIEYIILLYGIVVLVFVWNWYIHSAYHQKDHWLNRYKWFQRDKRLHFQHHINPWSNYGIASHFSDIIGGTFDYGSASSLVKNDSN